MYKGIIYLLLLTQRISNAQKGGGGVSRGSSEIRTNALPGIHSTEGFHFQTNYRPQQGGYHPQQGSYHPQPGGYRQPGTYHPASGYNDQQSGYPTHDKLKLGSSNTGTLKKALGAATGIATFESGKAILRSNSEPLKAPNGQNYYFDERNHQSKNGYFMCLIPIDDVLKTLQESSTSTSATDEFRNSTAMTPEQFFKTVQFQDGSKPKSLTWNCKSGTEVCCGTECCPAPKRGDDNCIYWIIFVRCVDILKFEQSSNQLNSTVLMFLMTFCYLYDIVFVYVVLLLLAFRLIVAFLRLIFALLKRVNF
uniref:CX domain-containing protein n=1 Tax=Onchocerca volvulus TaxID=6282 RepID=A0A8R1TM66_ONCVO